VAWVSGSAEVSGLDLGYLDGQLSGEGATGQGATPAGPASVPPVACQETLQVEEEVTAKWPGCRKVSQHSLSQNPGKKETSIITHIRDL
jgi:hypothetical protein